jgi:hypothetical protein
MSPSEHNNIAFYFFITSFNKDNIEFIIYIKSTSIDAEIEIFQFKIYLENLLSELSLRASLGFFERLFFVGQIQSSLL